MSKKNEVRQESNNEIPTSLADIQEFVGGAEKIGGKRGTIAGFFKPELVESLGKEMSKIPFNIGEKTGLTLDKVKFIPVSVITGFIHGNELYRKECENVQKKFDKRKNVVWSLATLAGKQAGLVQKTFTYKNKVNQIAMVSREVEG